MIKITMEYNGSPDELRKALGIDGQFELYDSIMWQLDYGTKDDRVGYHNDIKLEVSEEAYEDRRSVED